MMAGRMQEVDVTKADLKTATMFAVSQILVVDDDPIFVEIFRRVLAKNGCQVTSAVNGEQALQAVRTGRPDLALLDMMVATPLDGVEVVRKMANYPALAAVPNIMIPSLDSSSMRRNSLTRCKYRSMPGSANQRDSSICLRQSRVFTPSVSWQGRARCYGTTSSPGLVITRWVKKGNRVWTIR